MVLETHSQDGPSPIPCLSVACLCAAVSWEFAASGQTTLTKCSAELSGTYFGLPHTQLMVKRLVLVMHAYTADGKTSGSCHLGIHS